jgi:hypothetical protein
MNELLFVYLYSLSNQFVRGYVERLLVLNCVGTNALARMHKNLGGLDWFRSRLIGIAKLGSVNISSVVSKS